MQLTSVVRHPARVAFVLFALALAAGLLALSGPGSSSPDHRADGADLTIGWADGGRELQIVAADFRRRSVAQVRVGDQPWWLISPDESGTVRLSVPLDAATRGQVGTTVVVSGRAVSGAQRSLIGGVPPIAVGRGPVDLVPWLVAALLAAVAVGAAMSRQSRAAGAGTDPAVPALEARSLGARSLGARSLAARSLAARSLDGSAADLGAVAGGQGSGSADTVPWQTINA
jgi:hypothetical protein